MLFMMNLSDILIAKTSLANKLIIALAFNYLIS